MKERDRGSPFQYPTVENVGFNFQVQLFVSAQSTSHLCLVSGIVVNAWEIYPSFTSSKQPLCLLNCIISPLCLPLQQIESIIRHQKPIRRERKNSSSSSSSSSSSAHSPTIPSQHSIPQRTRRQHTTVRGIGDPHSAPPTPPPRLDSPQLSHTQPRAWKSLPRVRKSNVIVEECDSRLTSPNSGIASS